MLPYIAYMDPMGMENHGDEIGHFGGIKAVLGDMDLVYGACKIEKEWRQGWGKMLQTTKTMDPSTKY